MRYDFANGVAIDSSGAVYLTGSTDSSDYPTKNPFQAANGGGDGDAFVTKLSLTTLSSGQEVLNKADLIGQLRETPDRVAANDSENLISYSFKVKNVGLGEANRVKITLPIDPQLSIGYTEELSSGAWVSAVTATSVEISLPNLASNAEVSGTIVFRPNASPAVGNSVFTRYTLNWSNPAGDNQQVWSNAVSFSFGGPGSNQDVSEGKVQLMTPETGSPANALVYQSNFWIPDEMVTTWLTRPDNTSVALSAGRSNANGEFTVSVDSTGLASGTYVVAAYGQRSELYGSALLVVGASGSSQISLAPNLGVKELGKLQRSLALPHSKK